MKYLYFIVGLIIIHGGAFVGMLLMAKGIIG